MSAAAAERARVQKKSFTRWINSQLAKRGLHIEEITTDLGDGLMLIALSEIWSGTTIPRYNNPPKNPFQCIENLNLGLEKLRSMGVQLRGFSAESFREGDLKSMLGIAWQLILKVSIDEITAEEASAKEGLLLWCKSCTADYAECNVEDFHCSWQNGYGFNALIHYHRPELLDYAALPDGDTPEDRKARIEHAFSVAEEHFGVHRLLDPEDIVDTAKPDERSLMTYVAQYFHAFASERKAARGRGVVKRFLLSAFGAISASKQYDAVASDLAKYIETASVNLQSIDPPTNLDETQKVIRQFRAHRSGEERANRVRELLSLEALFQEVEATRQLANLPPHVPDLTVAQLKEQWEMLERIEEYLNSSFRESMIRYQKLEKLMHQINAQKQRISGFISETREFVDREVDMEIQALRMAVNAVDAKKAELARTQPVLDAVGLLVDEYAKVDEDGAIVARKKHLNMTAEVEALGRQLEHRRTALEKSLENLEKADKIALEYANKLNEFLRWINLHQDAVNALVSKDEESLALLKPMESKLKEEADLVSSCTLSQEITEIRDQLTELGVTDLARYCTVDFETVMDRFEILKAFVEERTADFYKQLRHLSEIELTVNSLIKDIDLFVKNIDDAKLELEEAGKAEDEAVALTKLTELQEKVSGMRESFDDLVSRFGAVSEMGVDISQHTSSTEETIALMYEQLNILIAHDKGTIQNSINVKESSTLTEDQIQEQLARFATFDVNHDSHLLRHELKALFSSMGEDVSDEEIAEMIPNEEEGITEAQFLRIMEDRIKVKDSPEDILEAFGLITDNQPFVTKSQIQQALGPEFADDFIALLPPYPDVPDAYDFSAFTNQMFDLSLTE